MNEDSSFELKIEKIGDDLKEIKAVLCGDAVKGRLGIIHHHNQMYADLYGEDFHGIKTKESVKNCLITRMSSIEDSHKKQRWMIAGATATGAVFLKGVWDWIINRPKS